MTPGRAYPTRADYPPPVPVICAGGPLLYPGIEGHTERAGHCYRRIDGTWTCRNCGGTP